MMKKLITILFVFLMLWGCSGTSLRMKMTALQSRMEKLKAAGKEKTATYRQYRYSGR